MNLIQRFTERDSKRKRETNDKKLIIEKEFKKAQELRQTSLETFCQTKEHKESDTETPQKRKRSSFSRDIICHTFLKSQKKNSSCNKRN